MKTKSTFGAALVAMALASAAQAEFISGTINFNSGPGGGVQYEPPNGTGTAVAIVTFDNPIVTEASGSFGSIAIGSTVDFTTPFVFNPFTPYDPLWRVETGSNWFEFELTSVALLQNDDFLNIAGTGIFTGNGFEPTPGFWRYSSQSPADDDTGLFSWSSAAVARPPGQQVPDGGTTLALLGASLLGLHGARRKFGKR